MDKKDNDGPLHVVVAGGGPAALLFALLLLEKGNGRFRVSLYEAREDPREFLKRKNGRSFSMNITTRARRAMSAIPGLWEKVEAVGSPVKFVGIASGGPKITWLSLGPLKTSAVSGPGAVVVEWAQLTSTLLTELLDRFGESSLLAVHFQKRCVLADLKRHFVGFEQSDSSGGLLTEVGEMERVPYDILVGADGARSNVRAAFSTQVRGFEVEQHDMWGQWATVHIPKPSQAKADAMLAIGPMKGAPSLSGMLLPDLRTNQCHLLLGWRRHEPPAEWVAITDPKEALRYLVERHPWLDTLTEAHATELVEQNRAPQTGLTVRCNTYADVGARAVLVGDSAHASAPTLGQGCNTSLMDAATLAHLMTGTTSNADVLGVLGTYSDLRVQEGQALVDLSDAEIPWSNWESKMALVRMVWGLLGSRVLPRFICAPPPIVQCGTDELLSEVYKTHRSRVDKTVKSHLAWQGLWQLRASAERTKAAGVKGWDGLAVTKKG